MKTVLRIAIVIALTALGAAWAQPEGTADAEAFRTAFLNGELSWDDVLDRAQEEGTVQWFHWGGSDELNTWIDIEVAPALAALGIELETSRLPNTRDAVDLVLTEADAGAGVGEGSIDAIWLNGENFRTLAEADMLLGPVADKLPNSQYFYLDPEDPRSAVNLFDFGYPTDLQEVPWSGAQFVCYVDTARLPVAEAPSTFAELEAWVRANPGRFTHVRPPNFIGNTFVQEVLYAHADGGADTFQRSRDSFTPEEFAEVTRDGYEFLRRIEPFLLGGSGTEGQGGNVIYPESHPANDQLFTNGEVDMVCQFGMYTAATSVQTGQFPETVRNIVFPEGNMIKNKNFIAIPRNAPNPAAALVLANVLSSPENQLSKLGTIGYALGVDPPLLPDEVQAQIDEVAPPLMGLTYDQLAANEAPDTNSSLVDVIEAIWTRYVEQGDDAPFEQIVEEVFANVN
jgi:putative spermidine/putrescine transport system substrate-binding protein